MRNSLKNLAAMAVLLLIAGLAPAGAAAQPATYCPPGQAPHYVFGFAALHEALGDWMGEPTTCEFPDPNGTGDVHQRTSQGLAFWRKSTNTPTFTNGWEHWAITDQGLVYWTGESIDPTPDAMPVAPPAAAPAPEPTPAPTPPTSYTPPYDPFGPDVDCGDFATHAEAQAFFEFAARVTGQRDRHGLDTDADGIACETLP